MEDVWPQISYSTTQRIMLLKGHFIKNTSRIQALDKCFFVFFIFAWNWSHSFMCLWKLLSWMGYMKHGNADTLAHILQISSRFLFPFFFPSLFLFSLWHKGAHCSWQNFNLLEIESRCGCPFSSQAGSGLFSFLGMLVYVGPAPHAWLRPLFWLVLVLFVFFFWVTGLPQPFYSVT